MPTHIVRGVQFNQEFMGEIFCCLLFCCCCCSWGVAPLSLCLSTVRLACLCVPDCVLCVCVCVPCVPTLCAPCAETLQKSLEREEMRVGGCVGE